MNVVFVLYTSISHLLNKKSRFILNICIYNIYHILYKYICKYIHKIYGKKIDKKKT